MFQRLKHLSPSIVNNLVSHMQTKKIDWYPPSEHELHGLLRLFVFIIQMLMHLRNGEDALFYNLIHSKCANEHLDGLDLKVIDWVGYTSLTRSLRKLQALEPVPKEAFIRDAQEPCLEIMRIKTIDKLSKVPAGYLRETRLLELNLPYHCWNELWAPNDEEARTNFESFGGFFTLPEHALLEVIDLFYAVDVTGSTKDVSRFREVGEPQIQALLKCLSYSKDKVSLYQEVLVNDYNLIVRVLTWYDGISRSKTVCKWQSERNTMVTLLVDMIKMMKFQDHPARGVFWRQATKWLIRSTSDREVDSYNWGSCTNPWRDHFIPSMGDRSSWEEE